MPQSFEQANADMEVRAFMGEMQGQDRGRCHAVARTAVVTFMNEVLELVMRRHIFAVFFPR
jgi:hypothetical protein